MGNYTTHHASHVHNYILAVNDFEVVVTLDQSKTRTALIAVTFHTVSRFNAATILKQQYY